MARFKVHKYNLAFMARLGIHSYNLTDPTNEFFKSFATFLNLFIAIGFFIISSGAFVYLNWPNLEIILEPFLMVMGGVQYAGMFLNLGLNMGKLKSLHLKLQEIVDKAEEGPILNIYWNAEKMCRKCTKVLVSFLFIDQMMFCVALISSVYNIIIGNLDTSTWELPFSITVPFNTECVSGWYMLCAIQSAMGISYSLCISSMTSYFISGCYYVGAICDHFETFMDSIKDDVESNTEAKESKPTKPAPKTYEKIEEKLRDLVEIHVQLIDVFNMVADIHSGSIFSLLLPNVLFVACTMFNVEHSSNEGPIMIVVCVICSSAWPFLFCYFATSATNRLAAISQSAYNSNWLDWPPKYQKYIILIIARSQQPVHFTGFGLFLCTLEVLGKLLKTSCSYYMVFRSFTQRQHN